MPQNATASSFLRGCEEWLCNGYSVDTRYIAIVGHAGPVLLDALLIFSPLPFAVDNRLSLLLPSFLAGQDRLAEEGKHKLLAIARSAVDGTITANGQELALHNDEPYRFQAPSTDRNTWFMPLVLQIHGSAPSTLFDLSSIDNALRAAVPPFDGLEDLRAWLELRPLNSETPSTITVVINPPVDIRVDLSFLSGGKLVLVLHAHPNANRSQIGVAVRAIPGDGLLGRVQVADRIAWGGVTDGRIEGRAEVDLPSATGALVMLLIGAKTVRRNWFLDPAKAPNHRFAAVQHFDTELRMLKRGLFEDTDSIRFETAVATLLLLLGFSPSVQLERNSPDLIVVSPIGRLVLVECTTRIADVATKIGKLVDRREALVRSLRESNQGIEVLAALVCRLPRDQIAVQAASLKSMRIMLAAAEEITDALSRARLPVNPEDILTQALRSMDS